MILNRQCFSDALEKYSIANKICKFGLRAALIDMDGVLYDSMKNHTKAWYRMATELGIECERDEFYLYEGMTGAATIDLLYLRAFGQHITEKEARVLYQKKAMYFTELGEPELICGAGNVLDILKANSIERVLVTGSGQKSILDKIDRDYPGAFDAGKRITSHDVTHGKPNAEPYLKGLKLAGVLAHESIVIENAPLGVKAGHDAGCFTIAITTGPIPESEMIKAGADLVFPTMPIFAEHLPSLIEILK